jgi:hypothetical protein
MGEMTRFRREEEALAILQLVVVADVFTLGEVADER